MHPSFRAHAVRVCRGRCWGEMAGSSDVRTDRHRSPPARRSTTPRSSTSPRLVGEWQLLADLAFADLLLWVPIAAAGGRGGQRAGFLCVAQCRPTTGPTAYQHDQVGVVLRGARVAPLRIALLRGAHLPRGRSRLGGRPADPARGDPGALTATRSSRSSARDANLASVRTPSQLELVYLQSAADLAAMVADGHVPGADARRGRGRRAAGRRRARPAGAGRHDHLRQPERAVGVQPARRHRQRARASRIDTLTSTVADDPFDASDLAAAVAAAIDGGHPASIELEAAERPSGSGRSRCARAARRSARCC